MADEERSISVGQGRKIGDVQIADEVVAVIAGLAASEVDGVDSMGSGFTGRLGMRNPGNSLLVILSSFLWSFHAVLRGTAPS